MQGTARVVVVVAAAALAAAAAGGCHTPVGIYFANRARDFGECWRVHLGLGVGLGGGVRAAGVVDAGLLGGMTAPWGGLTWDYGGGGVFGWGVPLRKGAGEPADLWLPAMHWSVGRLYGGPCPGADRLAKTFWLLPALTAFTEHGWLWDGEPDADTRWFRVHAFDVEVSAWALFLNVRAGFSPGEFADFLLGWFGVDLAGDDQTLAAGDG